MRAGGARAMEDGVQKAVRALRDSGKQQPVMATARRKTDMEGHVFTTAAGGGRLRGGREGFPGSARRSLGFAEAPGLGHASVPAPPFYGGGRGGGAHLVYGEGYSSALLIAAPTLPPHPCGMRA